MRMKRQLLPLLVVASFQLPATTLLAADAPPAPAAAAATPAPAAGNSANCIPLQSIESTKVLDDRTILFEMRNGDTLVNRLPHRCAGLGFEKSFGYKTSITQLCSQDIIWVLTHMGSGLERGASCGLGKFEPYVAPAADEAGKNKDKPEPK